MSQKIHEIYRVGGELRKAMAALEETISYRNRSGKHKEFMKIRAGFILQRHNEHQVEEFIQYCKKIGVDQYDIIGTCLRRPEDWNLYMPSDKGYWFYDEGEIARGRLVPKIRPDNHCGWIYSTMTIQVNGDVVPCCADPKGSYVLGNIFETNVYDIWNNKKYQRIRKAVSTRSNELDLCSLCSSYGEPPLGMNINLGAS
jgi:radical SAM protein with 4Fe4S-binding SPASM domain